VPAHSRVHRGALGVSGLKGLSEKIASVVTNNKIIHLVYLRVVSVQEILYL